MRREISLREIIRSIGERFEQKHSLNRAQRRVMRAIARCRTPALGGHLDGCNRCGFRHILWHSCRNRHCPRCQSEARQRWLEQRKAELLPVNYFHVVFTVPESLNPFALADPRRFYNILFAATNETLQVIARDPKRLGLRIGFLAVLHTWGQTLTLHPHLHCVVPAGGLTLSSHRWLAARRQKFFLPVRVLSRYFRRRFLEKLREALQDDSAFASRCQPIDPFGLLDTAASTEWVVYAKPPFGGPEQVLAYLARYTHRIAISDRRIVGFDGHNVRFSWRDRRYGEVQKIMELSANEFLRRFLLHVLPDRFVRIRHFGCLANRLRTRVIALARVRTRVFAPSGNVTEQSVSVQRLCPQCKVGQMLFLETVQPEPARIDSS
jgi:hypothetical protein